MSALIPYTAEEMGPGMVAMAPELYKDAKWAARKIGRAWKKTRKGRQTNKKRKLGRTDVGHPMRTVVGKREFTHGANGVNANTRTLYVQELTELQGAATGEDDRRRQIVNCTGLQITYHFVNKLDLPMFLNVAVIAPKHNSGVPGITDFFRGDDGSRGANFSDALSALQFHYYPINTDKYAVVRHHRHQLGSNTDGVNYNSDAGPGNWISKRQYIPINRQLRYETAIATSCSTPIYICWWLDTMDSPGGVASTVGAGLMSEMHTMFFTDVL